MGNLRGVDVGWAALSTAEKLALFPLASELVLGGKPLGALRRLLGEASRLAPSAEMAAAVDVWAVKYLVRAHGGEVTLARFEYALDDGALAFPYAAEALDAFENDEGSDEDEEDVDEGDDEEEDDDTRPTRVALPDDYVEVTYATLADAETWAEELAGFGMDRLVRLVSVGADEDDDGGARATYRLVVDDSTATFERVHLAASCGESADLARLEMLLASEARGAFPDDLFSRSQPLKLPQAVFDEIFDASEPHGQSRFALTERTWVEAAPRIAALKSSDELAEVLARYDGAPMRKDTFLFDERVRIVLAGEAARLGTKMSRLVTYAWATRER